VPSRALRSLAAPPVVKPIGGRVHARGTAGALAWTSWSISARRRMTDPTQRLTASRIELFSISWSEPAPSWPTRRAIRRRSSGRSARRPLFADWCSVDLLERDGRWRRRLLQQDNPVVTELQQIMFRDFGPTAEDPTQSWRDCDPEGRPRAGRDDRWIAERTANPACGAHAGHRNSLRAVSPALRERRNPRRAEHVRGRSEPAVIRS